MKHDPFIINRSNYNRAECNLKRESEKGKMEREERETVEVSEGWERGGRSGEVDRSMTTGLNNILLLLVVHKDPLLSVLDPILMDRGNLLSFYSNVSVFFLFVSVDDFDWRGVASKWVVK